MVDERERTKGPWEGLLQTERPSKGKRVKLARYSLLPSPPIILKATLFGSPHPDYVCTTLDLSTLPGPHCTYKDPLTQALVLTPRFFSPTSGHPSDRFTPDTFCASHNPVPLVLFFRVSLLLPTQFLPQPTHRCRVNGTRTEGQRRDGGVLDKGLRIDLGL